MRRLRVIPALKRWRTNHPPTRLPRQSRKRAARQRFPRPPNRLILHPLQSLWSAAQCFRPSRSRWLLATSTRPFVPAAIRSEEHTSELQSRLHLVCRLLLEKKKKKNKRRWYLDIIGSVQVNLSLHS